MDAISGPMVGLEGCPVHAEDNIEAMGLDSGLAPRIEFFKAEEFQFAVERTRKHRAGSGDFMGRQECNGGAALFESLDDPPGGFFKPSMGVEIFFNDCDCLHWKLLQR